MVGLSVTNSQGGKTEHAMNRTWIGVVALIACALAALGAQSRTTLDMYLIDV